MGRKNRYKDHAAKRERGGYVALAHVILRSESFANLSPKAVKLLMDLLAQYKGDNNGDLCAAWTLMKKRGRNSKATLWNALEELKEKGWIEVSRQGGRNRASLYAVTFFSVDECKGKLDIAPTGSPKGTWKLNEPLPPLAKLKVVTL